MRSSWNSAIGRHLFLATRRHHRQVIGPDVDADGHQYGDKAEPETPIMMRALPVRAVVMVHTIMVRPFVPVVTVLHFIEPFHVFSISNLDGDLDYGRLVFILVQPIWRTAVMQVEASLVFASDRRGRVELRAG